jgi:hypothetical protein
MVEVKMRRITAGLLFLLILGTLPTLVESKKTSDGGFVFGSIHGVPGLKHVYIQKLGKVYVGRFNRPKTHVDGSGTFYFDNVPPGEYYLAGFSNARGDLYWFHYTKETVKEVLFTVNPGDIQFMGSYEVLNAESNWFTKKGSFQFQLIDSPTEEELVVRLLERKQEDRWAARLETRADELGDED